jgi:hypothetical protein
LPLSDSTMRLPAACVAAHTPAAATRSTAQHAAPAAGAIVRGLRGVLLKLHRTRVKMATKGLNNAPYNNTAHAQH